MKAVANRFSQAATSYDEHAIFQQEIGDRLVERLDWFRLNPQRILDLGSGTGLLTHLLKKRFPNAQIIGTDIAFGMNAYAQAKISTRFWENKKHYFVTGDIHALPFKPHQFDLVISNCALQWCESLAVFQQAKSMLKPEGLFLFTTLGPDTLIELRKSFQQYDNYAHVHPFLDMHDLGDMLAQVGFLDPVMDRENLTMTYPNLKQLCADLKKTGANNLHLERPKGLVTKTTWQKVSQYYQEKFLTEENQFPATIEVLYGHAFHPQRIPTQVSTTQKITASFA